MGDVSIKTTNWRQVEVGRIVLIKDGGVSEGKLATIVQIIDHKRVLIDGPSILRRAISLDTVVLTPIILPGLPRACKAGACKAAWEKAGIDAKWAESAWAKKIAQKERRRALTDFERFKVLRLRKQERFATRVAQAKVVKASA